MKLFTRLRVLIYLYLNTLNFFSIAFGLPNKSLFVAVVRQLNEIHE